MLNTIWLRQWTATDILAPAEGDAVFLVAIQYEHANEAERRVRALGVTFGSTKTEVSVFTERAALTTEALVEASGRFVAELTIPEDGSTVIVLARNIDGAAAGTDRAAVMFRDAGLIQLEPHAQHNLEADRLAYVAGSPRPTSIRPYVR